MKLSTKLFLGIFGVTAATLLVFGYLILSVDFKKNLDYQIDNGTKDFQTGSLILSQSYDVFIANLDHKNSISLAASYADRSNPGHINLYTSSKEPVYTGISLAIPENFLDDASKNQYNSITIDGRKVIVFTGTVNVAGSGYILQTVRDVTVVYDNAESLRFSFIIILVIEIIYDSIR